LVDCQFESAIVARKEDAPVIGIGVASLDRKAIQIAGVA